MVVQVERDEVERPIVAQLEAMGWTHVPGTDAGTLDAAEPVLRDKLDAALRRINVRAADREPWMDGTDVSRAVAELTSVSLGKGVAQANFDATDLLLSGYVLHGPSGAHGGASATVQYVEWHEERSGLNEFTVVDQLRVRNRSGDLSILDIVLFVNGVPLVAVECKSSDAADPIRSAVLDLRHYAGDPVDDERDGTDLPVPAGVPELFRTVQLLVAATGETAYLGTVTSTPDHFHPWRSIEPESEFTLRAELPKDVRKLNERHKLVGVVLRPAAFLTFVRHYVIPLPVETESGGTRTVKAAARHQQYRATEKAVRKLLTGRTRGGPVLDDERGGIIWHTQGSGKSLTMTFLVRRMHLHHRLSEFTVVVVTDRTQLQDQLSTILKLSESDVETAETRTQMEGLLRDGGRRVVFAMIQKYGTGVAFAADAGGDSAGDDRNLAGEYEDVERARKERGAAAPLPVPDFPECNTSSDILVLVDEAHRSHTSVLHAALRKAIPNAAKIGFTGTPIMTGRTEDTRRIFGAFLDTYRMTEAEHDGVVVRIRYEGRTGEGKVFDKDGLDRNFADLIRDRTDEERKALVRRWPTERDVAESRPMIRAKAEDMLEHWVTWVLPGGGFKAQVAAVSRKAAVEYHHALRLARDTLLIELAGFDPASVAGIPLEELPRRMRYLYLAHQYRSLLRRIDFVPVISPGEERKRRQWMHWTDKERQKSYIARFHEAFPQPGAESEWVATTPFDIPSQDVMGTSGVADHPWSQEPTSAPEASAAVPDPVHPESPVAFLIVKSMLLTGFDAPREQALYLDRPIRDAELLQAVARVNRPMRGKDVGYVVDYYGVFEHLKGALAEYQQDDVDDTMRSLSEEVGALKPAAEAVHAFLRLHGVADADLVDPAKLGSAAQAFEDEAARFGYDEVLHEFLRVLERVLPHEKGLGYVADARRWGMLQKRVRRLYRDAPGGTFTLRRYGLKVRAMIADHLEGPEIEQVIAPVSLTSDAFDDAVRAMPPREAAAEMGHALRFHLEERVKREDPEKYTRLSERLEEILRGLPGRFEEQIKEFGPLFEQARQEDETDPALAGLSPLEQTVYRLLEQLLEDDPGVVRGIKDTRPLVGAVCDAAGEAMAKVSYQRQNQDVGALARVIHVQLVKGGLRPAATDWAPLNAIAQRLAAHAAGNEPRFVARHRGQ
ncbi:HsdR family type I site-specific deoxyribonuclease [Streptomyces venezuelae]|uniref:type I restriction endonuclease subunit R n=1 Tax=Streptomyces gardneri TaxID=66892 RepID=UPI0006BC5A32|nr:type I restriction endonuclease [Streptomyces gardneri]ALO08571.1 HsdR family type I site-specific deoxyribonuclease [Streptomyces venezuelae]QPK45774.1 type I restriction endonuclease subunit R [Streptomyces gardneri]WRK37121.1 type I restriction endonuclease [Streptomyces venezuelae]CUM41059.1 Type I restriction-modification system, restriction subunit R [Streptomyces venezuelae]